MKTVPSSRPSRLPDYPAFLRLSDRDSSLLLSSAEIWEVPAGGVVFYPGDAGESLILVTSGLLESSFPDDRGVRLYFPGDLWGVEKTRETTQVVEAPLRAISDTVYLGWPHITLRGLADGSLSLRRALKAEYDGRNTLVSGLPPFSLPGAVVSSEKKITRSFRALLPGLVAAGFAAVVLALLAPVIAIRFSLPGPFVLALPLAAPVVFLCRLLVFMTVRSLYEYRVSPEAVTSSSVDWSRMTCERRCVPIEKIKGVEIERAGISRRIFRYGTITIQTAAKGGDVVMKDISLPDALGRYIRTLTDGRSQMNKSRERESMRRKLEHAGMAGSVPRLLEPAAPPASPLSGSAGIRCFRKSPAILAGRLLLPLGTAAAYMFGIAMLRRFFLQDSASPELPWLWIPLLLLLAWAWYRFEDWRNDRFGVSGACATDLYRKPLGMGESSHQVDLATIQNIRTEQKGFSAFLFRYGDVILVTAGGAADMVFRGVSHPWRIQEAIFRSREAAFQARDRAAHDRNREELILFAEAMDQIRHGDGTGEDTHQDEGGCRSCK